MLTQIQKQKFLLRGGGCLSAKYIRPKKIRATHITTDFNKSFIHYVEMIETEASVAESKKIITAIQWFIFQEQNIYKLNLDAELIIFYYNLILDGIRRLLQSCSIYFKTDIFKCLYFLQVTAYLSKVIFSFHLHYKLRYMMNRETKNQLLEICDKTQQYLKIEKNNFIQNQLELFLFLTKTSLEIIPTNRNEKEEMLQGCLHEIISLFITMSPKSEILQALYQGACLSYQKQDIPQRKKEYEVFYQLDMLQWEVIGYFQDKDKQYERILEDIISEIEAIYEKLMKSSKNWQDHYFWISMINKILINNPYLTTKRFGELNNPFNIGLNDDNKSGLIIEDYVESNQQIPLRLLDILYQKYKDFLNNDEWKIKQGLIFNIIYISSCSFTDAIISFYQNILIQFWVFEKDQRVRSLLKNSHLISFQKKMFQDNCQTKQESLAREIQQVLKKIDELQESTFYKANLKEMDEIIMQLDEYIKNISEMCEQLGLTTDFANPFKKCVLILEGKRNQMREESVRQLLEIRKLKVFKEAAKNTATSIYVPLKTKERCKNQLNNLVNLEQLDDKFGEVNQFLHEDKTVLLIHGMAGSGKSRAAKKIEEFIWKLNDNNTKIQNYKLIPVYISLASLKNPIFQAVEEALHQDDYGFDDLQLKKCQEMLQKQEFRFVLIMDSYDELKQENMEKNLYITNKLKQNWSNPLVIFTTRSEILTSIHYRNWFAPMENNNIKEIKLLKFDKEQQKEYLKQFVIQSIKLLIFELWESQINIDQIEDINRLELFWEKLQSLLKFDIFKMNSASLLDQQQIEKIILFSKDNEFKALQREEDQRNLSLKLHKLWSVEMYQKMMRQANLTKLVQTPKMMEIVVQVLPQMMDEVTNKNNMKQNFVKNFSLMLKEFLKSQYMFHMYKQQQNTHLMGLENEIEQRYKTETVNDQYDVLEITPNDLQYLETIEYNLVACDIWNCLEKNSILIQITEEFDRMYNTLQLILEPNLPKLICNKVQIQNENIIQIVYDALKEYNLTIYDFYLEFINYFHLKQFQKKISFRKGMNIEVFLIDLFQYSTQLAKKMSKNQATQVQYKQQELNQDQRTEEEWLNQFFNDNDENGFYKKEIRSCSLVQQNGACFFFVHKSIQEFLIAADLYQVLSESKALNIPILKTIIEVLSQENGSEQNCLEFLSSIFQKYCNHNKNSLENLSQFDSQQNIDNWQKTLKSITQLINQIKNHDINSINYSTEIYAASRYFLINKISQEVGIIEFFKFMVHLTKIDNKFIISGSNLLNILVEMKADLTNQNFGNIRIQNTSLFGCNFAKSNLSKSKFDNVNINGINLSGAQLFDCNWKYLKIDDLYFQDGHGHDDHVYSVGFSPDGTKLASGSGDKSIRLWDVKTGQQKAQFDDHYDHVRSVCFSPDGTILASGSDDKSARLWDVKTGQVKFILDGHFNSVYSVCFSPDGTTLASGSIDKSIRLWDIKTGQQKVKLDGHSYGIYSVCFSPNGNILASGSSDKSIRLWYVKTGQEKAKLDGHSYYVNSVCFSPDCTTLASGSSDKSIRLWDVKTGQVKFILNGHCDSICSVCFSPDGTTLLSGSKDKSIRVWCVKKIQPAQKSCEDLLALKTLISQPNILSENYSILIISQQVALEVQGALILNGEFTDHQGKDLRSLLNSNGSIILDS